MNVDESIFSSILQFFDLHDCRAKMSIVYLADVVVAVVVVVALVDVDVGVVVCPAE